MHEELAAARMLTSGDIKDSSPNCYIHWLVWTCAVMLFQLAEGQLLQRDHLNTSIGRSQCQTECHKCSMAAGGVDAFSGACPDGSLLIHLVFCQQRVPIHDNLVETLLCLPQSWIYQHNQLTIGHRS